MIDAVADDFSLGVNGFSFADLYEPRRLRDLHTAFWNYAADSNPGLAARFASLADATMTKPQASEILIDVANVLGLFLAQLFDIRSEV